MIFPPLVVHGFKRQRDEMDRGMVKYVFEGEYDDGHPEYRKFILRHNELWDYVFFYMLDDDDNIKACYVVDSLRCFCQQFVYLIRVNSLSEIDCGMHHFVDRVVVGYKDIQDIQDVLVDNMPDIFVYIDDHNELVCYRDTKETKVSFYIDDTGIEVSHGEGSFLVSDCTAKSLVTVVKNIIGDGLMPVINRKGAVISL